MTKINARLDNDGNVTGVAGETLGRLTLEDAGWVAETTTTWLGAYPTKRAGLRAIRQQVAREETQPVTR